MLDKNAYGEYYAQTNVGTPIYMAPEALAVGNVLHILLLKLQCVMLKMVLYALGLSNISPHVSLEAQRPKTISPMEINYIGLIHDDSRFQKCN